MTVFSTYKRSYESFWNYTPKECEKTTWRHGQYASAKFSLIMYQTSVPHRMYQVYAYMVPLTVRTSAAIYPIIPFPVSSFGNAWFLLHVKCIIRPTSILQLVSHKPAILHNEQYLLMNIKETVVATTFLTEVILTCDLQW